MTVRRRHPSGAYVRETHTSSPLDFGAATDHLYGSQMDLEAVTSVDLGAGSVTDGAVMPGGLDGNLVIRAGTLPATSFDLTPPALPSSISVDSVLTSDADGRTLVAIRVMMLPPTDPDYFATYIETTDLSDGDPITPVPIWTRPIITVTGKDITTGYILGVAGATQYWVRMRTVDVQGNYSIYSAIYPVLTLADTSAPGIPQGVAGAGGFKSIGVRWTSSSATDLMYNEVRYAPDLAGAPNTASWTTLRTRANSLIIDNLAPGAYWAQVRAIDFSRNVFGRWAATGLASTDVFTCVDHTFVNDQKVAVDDWTGAPELDGVDDMWIVNVSGSTFQLSLTIGGAAINISTNFTGFIQYNPETAVNALSEAESGWAPLVGPFTAALVGASDVAFNSVITNILSAGYIDAATIQTGVMTIDTGAGTADGIKVRYGGVEVGLWDESGIKIRSKTAGRSTLDYLAFDDASLVLYADGGPTSAITKDGINASAINFGTAQGGHNLVFNSSFELSAFIATSALTIGSGGSTFAGGVGGWVLVTNTNGTLGASTITMATL
jgi:hypothetical protein